jgi:alkylation response protein AidB-like acyl-CoA dehydrogenase
MEFRLNDEQQQMQESARGFFENEEVIETARAKLDGDDVVEDLWSDLADMDYSALTVPFEYGGLGDGNLYLSLLLEEAGRVALPAPLPEVGAFVTPLLAEHGTEEQKEEYLESIAEGDLIASFGVYETGHERLPDDIQLDVEAGSDSYRLNGTKSLVPFADVADSFIVAARSGTGDGFDGVSLFIVDSEQVDIESQDPLDRTRPLSKIRLDGVEVSESALLGELHEGGSALEEAMDWYTVARCSMLVGAADQAVDLSTKQAKEREQFGQPIGKFQAVKHRISEMWMDLQGARALTQYAAWALDADEPDAERAVSEAKVFCAENLTGLFGDDILNHGGMGYTWEHDGHIYFKQSKEFETFFGTPTEHLDRVAKLSGI